MTLPTAAPDRRQVFDIVRVSTGAIKDTVFALDADAAIHLYGELEGPSLTPIRAVLAASHREELYPGEFTTPGEFAADF